jgi:hypothetical protein
MYQSNKIFYKILFYKKWHSKFVEETIIFTKFVVINLYNYFLYIIALY